MKHKVGSALRQPRQPSLIIVTITTGGVKWPWMQALDARAFFLSTVAINYDKFGWSIM
jgi:hypothetical protein